jgi:hypothetical protein
MILPDQKDIALRNIIGSAVVLAVFALATACLHLFTATFTSIALASVFLFLVFSLVVRKYGKGLSDDDVFQSVWKRLFLSSTLLLVLGLLASNVLVTPAPSHTGTTPSLIDTHKCKDILPYGQWEISNKCDGAEGNPALCSQYLWVWDDSVASCKYHHLTPAEATGVFRNKHVVFAGDSTVRYLYHQFNRMVDVSNTYVTPSGTEKHVDLIQVWKDNNITVEFKWAPYVINITKLLQANRDKDFYVVGATLWDALHIHNLNAYGADLKELADTLSGSPALRKSVLWIDALKVIDNRLNTDEKKLYMNEVVVETYRERIRSTLFDSLLMTRIVSTNVTKGMEESSSDGVHYGPDVYGVLAELAGNTYRLYHQGEGTSKQPAAAKPHTSSSKGKPTGAMSQPIYGLGTLFVAFIMLFTWDSFLGVGSFSLLISGRSYDWNEAYMPLLKKLFPSKAQSVDEEKAGLLELPPSDKH